MVTEAGDRPVILFNPRLARYFASLLTLHKNARKWDLCCAHPVPGPACLDIFLCTCSGDVGLGLNVRRMRNEFLSLFTVTYSLRPLGESGSVFRSYPGQWKVRRCSQVAPNLPREVAQGRLLQHSTGSGP